eukprot:2908140-Pleurochrysis_carterae.AAC.3
MGNTGPCKCHACSSFVTPKKTSVVSFCESFSPERPPHKHVQRGSVNDSASPSLVQPPASALATWQDICTNANMSSSS